MVSFRGSEDSPWSKIVNVFAGGGPWERGEKHPPPPGALSARSGGQRKGRRLGSGDAPRGAHPSTGASMCDLAGWRKLGLRPANTRLPSTWLLR